MPHIETSHADAPGAAIGGLRPGDRSEPPRIAIIGAGVTGISCAEALRKAGLDATLYEKSRSQGGRLATRRNQAGDQFDHGAQYITSRTPQFGLWLDTLRVAGSAAVWEPRLGDAAKTTHHPWLVGSPGMNALMQPLAGALDIRLQSTISAVTRDGSGWQLVTAETALPASFDMVISTLPCPQAHALLDAEPALQAQLAPVTIAPCWALMISLDAALGVDFDARRFETGAIGWMARQASRPGAHGASNTWVVHASASWSADHLELSAEEVTAALLRELVSVTGHTLAHVSFAQAHRWRFGMTTHALGQPFLANADGTLFVAGDWCLGARVECAYESGVAVAQAVAERWKRLP